MRPSFRILVYALLAGLVVLAAGAIALAAATLAGLLLLGFKPVRISPLTGEPVVRHRAEQPRAKQLQR